MQAQPQQMTAVPAVNMQPQPIVYIPAQQPFVQNPNHLNYKRIINGLAIAELALGSIFVILGIATIFFTFSIGQGIWCGVWVVVAGALGVPSAKAYSSRCMMTCHFAFSIIAAVFTAVLFSMCVLAAIVSGIHYNVAGPLVNSLLALAAFTAMILHIVSACYSGALIRCSSCCQAGEYYGEFQGQVYTQQTVTAQGAPVNQPGCIVQGYQPAMASAYPNTTPQPMSQPIHQVVQNPNAQYPEKHQGALGQAHAASAPPAYETAPAQNQM